MRPTRPVRRHNPATDPLPSMSTRTAGCDAIMHSLSVDPSCDLDELVSNAMATTRPGDPVVVVLPNPPLSVNVIPSVGAHARAQLIAEGASLDPSGESLVVPMRTNPRDKPYSPNSSWAAYHAIPRKLHLQQPEAELAFAVTDYKLQGKTVDYLVVVLRRPYDGRVTPRLSLRDLEVLLSRVRKGCRLFVLGFDKADPEDQRWLLRLRHPPELHLWMTGYTAGVWDPVRVRQEAQAYMAAAPAAPANAKATPRRVRDGCMSRATPLANRANAGHDAPAAIADVLVAAGVLDDSRPSASTAIGMNDSSGTNAEVAHPPSVHPGGIVANPRYVVARYNCNSCPYDAALAAWESCHRWMRRCGLGELSYPPLAEVQYRIGDTARHATIWRTVDLAGPMCDWLALREQLRSRLSRPEWIRLQDGLTDARDALRRADAHHQVGRPHASETQLDSELERTMTRSGIAAKILGRMLLAAPRVYRVHYNAHICKHCGLHPLSDNAAITDLTAIELEQCNWCPWATFQALTAAVPRIAPMNDKCDHPCNTLRRISVANCDAEAPADVVVLGLPDVSIGQYQGTLRPWEDRTLADHQATYRLISMVMFTGNVEAGHYITVARDPDAPNDTWVCFDANANAGVGWQVPPPTGFDTFAPPTHAKATRPWLDRYWPVLLTYVRTTDPPNGKAGSQTTGRWWTADQSTEEAFVLRCFTQAAGGRDECTFDALFECMRLHNSRILLRHRASVEDALVRLEATNRLMHREGRIHLL